MLIPYIHTYILLKWVRKLKCLTLILVNSQRLFFYYTGWNTNTSQYSRNRPVQLGIFSSTFWRSINTNLMPSMVYFLKTVGADTILTFLINIIIFFFFRNKHIHTHTREREKGSNTKVQHKLYSKVILTFKGVWGKLYYIQHTLLSNVRQLPFF